MKYIIYFLFGVTTLLYHLKMQKPYQHKVMLCDRDDFCVMEVVAGKMVFPDEADLRKLQGQADGGSMELT